MLHIAYHIPHMPEHEFGTCFSGSISTSTSISLPLSISLPFRAFCYINIYVCVYIYVCVSIYGMAWGLDIHKYLSQPKPNILQVH